MKHQLITSTFLWAVLLAGCSQDDNLPTGGATLGISVNTAQRQTRALVETTTLPANSEIGMAVTDNDGNPYGGSSSAGNIHWNATGAGETQTWATDTPLLLSEENAKVYAYYPYSSAVTDITAIPVTAAEQKDYMYANMVSGINASNSTATLVMNHALTAIRLNIVKGTYEGAGNITKLSVRGAAVASSAKLNAKTGEVFDQTGTEATVSKNITLSDVQQGTDLIAVPTGNKSALTITLTIDGNEYSAITTDVLCQKGQVYTYSLTANKGGIEVGNVAVGEWGYNNAGNIVVDLGYKVFITGEVSDIALNYSVQEDALTVRGVPLTYGNTVKPITTTGNATVTQQLSDGVRIVTVSQLNSDVTIAFNGVGYAFWMEGDKEGMNITKTVSDDGTSVTVVATPLNADAAVKPVTGTGAGTLTQSVNASGVRTINVTGIAGNYTILFNGVNKPQSWGLMPDGVYYVAPDFSRAETPSSDCIGVVISMQGKQFMIEKKETSNSSYKNALEGGTRFYWGDHGTDQSGIPNYTSAHSSRGYGYIPNESNVNSAYLLSGDIGTWTGGYALGDLTGKFNSEVLKGVTSGGSGNTAYATIGALLKSFNANSSDNCGKSDWYIPSCGQLALMCMYMTSINKALTAIGGTQLAYGSYWSSSEFGSAYGWYVSFYDGYVKEDTKNCSYCVRFIRDL